MQIEQKQIDEMKNMLSMFDDNIQSDNTIPNNNFDSSIDENTKAMKIILESFNEFVDEEVQNCVDHNFSSYQREEIQNTQLLENGFKYKNWECLKDSKKNEYVVRTSHNKQIIYRFMLKESALIILKMLNNNIPLSNSNAMMILENEQKYIRALNDKLIYKDKNTQLYEARIQRVDDILIECKNKVVAWYNQYRVNKNLK